MKKEKRTKKTWWIISGIIVFIIIFANLTDNEQPSEKESKEETEQKKIEATNKRLEEKAKKTEEQNKTEKTEEEKVNKDNQPTDIEKDIKKRVSKNIQTGDVKNVKLYSDSLGSNLTIELLGSENLSDKLTIEAMKYNVLDALYSLKGIDKNFDDITINVKYPLTDSMGKTKKEYVIKSKWSQNIVEDMTSSSKFTMVDDMESLSEDYWQHPALNN